LPAVELGAQFIVFPPGDPLGHQRKFGLQLDLVEPFAHLLELSREYCTGFAQLLSEAHRVNRRLPITALWRRNKPDNRLRP
jgi:hypothetical protein